jgi:SAM-dependent methyltransferase
VAKRLGVGRRRWPGSPDAYRERRAAGAGEPPPVRLPVPGPINPGGPRPYVFWPAFPPDGYLGQLHPDFQRSLAEQRSVLERQDCIFYHTIEMPDGEVIPGPWDLRSRESEYLGHVPLAGRRVLEFGPSTGHLTFWMEDRGAEVVCFDAGWDVSIDLVPAPGGETRKLRTDHAARTCEFQNSWWYVHQRRRSKAKMVYGDIYRLPGDLGEFDVCTFGSILLHLRSPIEALWQGARRTRSQIVVTETWPEGDETLMDNIMRIFPVGEGGRWVVWWEISAGAVVAMLEIMGFGKTQVVRHTQRHQHGHRADIPYVEQPMYTVIGERT